MTTTRGMEITPPGRIAKNALQSEVQKPFRLGPPHHGESGQELLHRLTSFEMLDEALYRDAGPCKDRGAPKNAWIGMKHFAGTHRTLGDFSLQRPLMQERS
jgi:hypothetical protein